MKAANLIKTPSSSIFLQPFPSNTPSEQQKQPTRIPGELSEEDIETNTACTSLTDHKIRKTSDEDFFDSGIEQSKVLTN